MMGRGRDQVTVLGDIHANLAALEAALAEMDRRGHHNPHGLGDLVGYGASPNEVIDLVRARGLPTIMGNYDQGIGLGRDDCGCACPTAESRARGDRSIRWTSEETTAENKAFLRSLAGRIRLQLGDLIVTLVHGSPRRINEYLYEDRPVRSLERLLDGAEAEVLVCGHTHLPYHRVLPSGRHVANAGSVGQPKDGDPRACYAVLAAEGDELSVEFVRVAYDIERAAQAIEASPMPDEFAQMLRSGAGEGSIDGASAGSRS